MTLAWSFLPLSIIQCRWYCRCDHPVCFSAYYRKTRMHLSTKHMTDHGVLAWQAHALSYLEYLYWSDGRNKSQFLTIETFRSTDDFLGRARWLEKDRYIPLLANHIHAFPQDTVTSLYSFDQGGNPVRVDQIAKQAALMCCYCICQGLAAQYIGKCYFRMLLATAERMI